MKEEPETLRVVLDPNRGAQRDFLRSAERYPALIGGQGSGKTWGGAAKLVKDHLQWAGTDSMGIEPTFPNLRQIMIPALTDALDHCHIEHKLNLQTMEIATPALGSKIILHSAYAAEAITGFEVGRTWIDEPARMPNRPEPKRNVWLAAVGRTRDERVPQAERRIMVTGTHEGEGTWVYAKWEKDPKPGYVVFRAKTSDNPSAREQLQIYLDEYGPELARQYVYGYAVSDSMAAIQWKLIEELQVGGATRGDLASLKNEPGPLFVGMDIGRSQSLTVFWVLAAAGPPEAPTQILRTVCVIEMKDATFANQTEVLDTILGMPAVARLAIDATYNPQTAEDALTRYGPNRVDPVQFTAATKVELFQGWVAAAQERRLLIPPGDDIAMDFFSVKRVVTSSGRVTYSAPFTADGHADRATAAALAVRAAASGGVVQFSYTPGPALAGAGMRGL